MPSGVPIDRQWVYVLEDGRPIIDWGDEVVQDILSGDFFTSEKSDDNHPIRSDSMPGMYTYSHCLKDQDPRWSRTRPSFFLN
jgi:hypothetical protein